MKILKNKKIIETITIIFVFVIYAFILSQIIKVFEKENNKSNVGCYCTVNGTYCPESK